MLISGTLREFILSDVMQLLTQQKVTGKLVLENTKGEGVVVFKDGNVVTASRENETFSSKLFYYCTMALKQQKSKMRELFSSCEGRMSELTDKLVQQELLSKSDIENYAETVVMDITCSLFLWTTGSYRFESLKNVDLLIPAGISIPVENVVMEAMRRIDEWRRMCEAINEEAVMVKTGKKPDFPDTTNVIDTPAPYYYQQITGTHPVKVVLQNSFHTEYKVYESLYTLLQSGLICFLSDTLTRSVHAAISRKKKESIVLTPVLSVVITGAAVLFVLLFSWLYRVVLFHDLSQESVQHRNRRELENSKRTIDDAYLFLRADDLSINNPQNELYRYFLITKKDIDFLQSTTDPAHKNSTK